MGINFYLERRKTRKNPELLILLYIRFSGNLIKVGTGEKIRDEHWSIETQRPVEGSPGCQDLTDLLDSMEEEIKSVTRQARILRKDVTVEYLRINLTFITKQDYTFFDIWDKWISQESANKEWTESTKTRYESFKKKLQEIDKSMKFSSLNNDFF
jgi:hypothetical protein